MIILQAFSLIFFMTWLWNLRGQILYVESKQLETPRTERQFYGLIGKLTAVFLNQISPKTSLALVEFHFWKDASDRVRLLLLGLHQLSYFPFLIFILLFMRINPLFVALPLFVMIGLLKATLKKQWAPTDWILGLCLMIFLVEPALRLFSMIFTQGEPSGIWFFLTDVNLLNILVCFAAGFALSLLFERIWSWNFFVSTAVVVLVLSYQMSLLLGLFFILGERFSGAVQQCLFLKNHQVVYWKKFFAVQVLGLAALVVLLLAMDLVSSSDREARTIQVIMLYGIIQSVFLFVTMTFGHFQAIQDGRKPKT